VLDLSRDQWDAAVSSVASIRDTGYVYPAYNASKAVLNQLTVSADQLASALADDAAHVNGVCLPVDRGLSARCL
jgi:NAD(P)-dependent dehydrogenase (short-subunit alcohol dehydrogenase family)